jgi:hypothetical protein
MAGNEPGITGFTGIQVGDGRNYPASTPLWAINSSIVTVVATTVTATRSVDTTAALSGFTVGDAVFASVGAASGLSAGVTLDAWVSSAGTATIRYSNVSTAAAAQIATPIILTAFKRVAV